MTQLGWLDTNLFIHALFRQDPHHARCRSILGALQEGRAEGWIDPVVVHELTYVLGRLPQFPDRAAIYDYLRNILAVDAVRADDKPVLLDALALWVAGPASFADARLAALARSRGLPVCSVNRDDFPGLENTYFAARVDP